MSKSDNDNHSNQMNPNNDAYWQSRGWDEKPEDWEEAKGQEKGRQEGQEKGPDKKDR